MNPYESTRLILKEKVVSITVDPFDIKLDPGDGQQPQPIFKVHPNWMTSKKAFHDMEYNYLFELRKERFHLLHEHVKLVDYDDETFCEIKKNFQGTATWVQPTSRGILPKMLMRYTVDFGSKFTIIFSSPGAGDQVLVMEGNWRGSTAQIRHEGSGQVCAEVHRKAAFESLDTSLVDQEQTYMVTIAPGVDYAALSAICIALDEWENDPLSPPLRREGRTCYPQRKSPDLSPPLRREGSTCYPQRTSPVLLAGWADACMYSL